MVYLHMVASEFGIKGIESVRAPYASIEEAEDQAAHNLEKGVQRPLRIVDEEGNVLVSYE